MSDSHRTILIVDDDADICQNMKDILEEFGYRADMAHNGAAAMKLVKSNRYDVALLDFKMPDTDGATLYQNIRQVQPSLVAIMVTAYAGSDGVERAKDAGTWQVLRKPVDFYHLLGLIEKAANQPVVLVVDDDHDFCENIWSILREHGMRVAIAHDNDSAIELLADLDLQVVLLDLHIGSKLCTPVFERLLSIEPMPATLLITGDLQDGVAEGLVSRGAQSLSLKPLDMDAVIAEIRSLLSETSG